MFITLFQYWGYNDVLLIAATAATAWGVLAVWSQLWVKGWVGSHSFTLGLWVCMIILPMILCVHSQIAEKLADNQRGLNLLKSVVEREPDRNMAMFVDRYALSSSNRQEFERNLLAVYAKHLYEKKPHLYLPVTEWPKIKPNKCNLADVYASRGTSQFANTAMNASNCDKLYQNVREYLAVQQQIQNIDDLLKGYAWVGWLVLSIVISFAILPYQILGSINRRYCVPYPMK